MKFEWFKNLFHKNRKSLAVFGKENVHIYTFEELSPENQQHVLESLSELNIDNYVSILKYSEDVANKSNINIGVLYKIGSELNDSIERLKQLKEEYKNLAYLVITDKEPKVREEISSVIGEISLLEKEAELIKNEVIETSHLAYYKAIVFKEFMRRVNEKKPSFLSVFAKAEKMNYAAKIAGLNNEYDRLTTSIDTVAANLYSATHMSLISNNPLVDEMGKKTDYYSNMGYFYNRVRSLNEINKNFINDGIQKPNFDNIHARFTNWATLHLLYYSDESEVNFCYKRSSYEKHLGLLSSYKLDIDTYSYMHRNDYRFLVDEMNKITERYSKTGSWRWNLKEVKKTCRKYDRLVGSYLEACGRFIDAATKAKIKESLFNLEYLWFASCDARLGERSAVFERNEKYDLFYQRSKDFVLKIAREKLNEKDVKFLEKNWNDVVTTMTLKSEVHYLFDIDNDDYDEFNTIVSGCNYHNRLEECNALYLDLDRLLNYLSNDKYRKWKYDYDEYITIEDLYYTLKLIDVNEDFMYRELFDIKYDGSDGINHRTREMMIKAMFKKFERQYDDRIMIIPSYITPTCNEEYFTYSKSFLTGIAEDSKRNVTALFLQTEDQVKSAAGSIYYYKNIKYIFVKRSALGEYKDMNLEHIEGPRIGIPRLFINEKIKIITVPDDTKYYQLSELLDKELDKPLVRDMI